MEVSNRLMNATGEELLANNPHGFVWGLDHSTVSRVLREANNEISQKVRAYQASVTLKSPPEGYGDQAWMVVVPVISHYAMLLILPQPLYADGNISLHHARRIDLPKKAVQNSEARGPAPVASVVVKIGWTEKGNAAISRERKILEHLWLQGAARHVVRYTDVSFMLASKRSGLSRDAISVAYYPRRLSYTDMLLTAENVYNMVKELLMALRDLQEGGVVHGNICCDAIRCRKKLEGDGYDWVLGDLGYAFRAEVIRDHRDNFWFSSAMANYLYPVERRSNGDLRTCYRAEVGALGKAILGRITGMGKGINRVVSDRSQHDEIRTLAKKTVTGVSCNIIDILLGMTNVIGSARFTAEGGLFILERLEEEN